MRTRAESTVAAARLASRNARCGANVQTINGIIRAESDHSGRALAFNVKETYDKAGTFDDCFPAGVYLHFDFRRPLPRLSYLS
jgi:hypothetical protein